MSTLSARLELSAARLAVERCRERLEALAARPNAPSGAIESARENLALALDRLAAAEWSARIDNE